MATALYLDNTLTIKAGTESMGNFSELVEESNPEKYYELCQAINSLQKRTLDKVVYTEQYRLI